MIVVPPPGEFRRQYANDRDAEEHLREEYTRRREMAVFYYTLRNAKKLSRQNGHSLEYNWRVLEAQRATSKGGGGKGSRF
ncbi:unnamed protein product [Amoebophrya sp. A25]|nr:unnamed protein product [Amoebophrya sp. A25]|eukprot:GSA25T00008795001.1